MQQPLRAAGDVGFPLWFSQLAVTAVADGWLQLLALHANEAPALLWCLALTFQTVCLCVCPSVLTGLCLQSDRTVFAGAVL